MAAHTITHPNYFKIYLTLVVLAGVSVLGPTLGLPLLTLITAFGIAIVKATMVAGYFMHLSIEKRYIWFLLLIMLAFMGVLFAGVAPDVMKQSGRNWTQVVAPPPHAPLPHE
ncbi:MAG TPA: cytochrome C oxidase subunit IV family protein [Methylomirabilota bacterium]|jgi:caa(3)-type oxidase subunit IV|nr:cytochrome C oxidase subunit IV family protein [Methylomirabilota bacterium]